MRRLLALLLLVAFTCSLVGCSGDKNKGSNRDKDRPRQTTVPAE